MYHLIFLPFQVLLSNKGGLKVPPTIRQLLQKNIWVVQDTDVPSLQS